VKVKVGVGNIRGSAELKMELTEAVRPQRAQYKGQGTAVGSQVNVIAGFDLEPNGETTKVVWKGETSVFGKLASMAGGMLEPLGRKNIQKLIEGLQKALSEAVAAKPLATAVPIAVPTNGEAKENATPAKSASNNSVQAEAPSLTPSNSDAHAQVPNITAANSVPQVEAPSFSSVNSETNDEGASAPAPKPHGNDNA
jgi:hypothetical protein